MKNKSLTEALKGRLDVPSIPTASRWIKRGWIKANGGGSGGNRYQIDSEALYQLRVLYKLMPYCKTEVMRQIGVILQHRHEDPNYNGWLGVLEATGKVVNVPWDTIPGKHLIEGKEIATVINLHKMPSDPDVVSEEVPDAK